MLPGFHSQDIGGHQHCVDRAMPQIVRAPRRRTGDRPETWTILKDSCGAFPYDPNSKVCCLTHRKECHVGSMGSVRRRHP